MPCSAAQFHSLSAKAVRLMCVGSVIVSNSGTSRRIEDPKQRYIFASIVFERMPLPNRQINAGTSGKFAGLIIGPDNAASAQDKNSFFVSVIVVRSLTRRNYSNELSHLLAPDILINHQIKRAVAGWNRPPL